MFLWILCYCIHDTESLKNLKTFLALDTFTTAETMIECPLLTVNFFSKYILSSVESIVHDIIGNKKEFLCQKIREYYISKHDRKLFPKIQEFVYYSTASEFINIMLHYKENPMFHENNMHTTLVQQMMKQINPALTKKEEEPFYEATNLYKLFFSSIPLIIKQQHHGHWKLILSKFKIHEQHQNLLLNILITSYKKKKLLTPVLELMTEEQKKSLNKRKRNINEEEIEVDEQSNNDIPDNNDNNNDDDDDEDKNEDESKDYEEAQRNVTDTQSFKKRQQA
jgi:hypothetical protein